MRRLVHKDVGVLQQEGGIGVRSHTTVVHRVQQYLLDLLLQEVVVGVDVLLLEAPKREV
jgi:hypothetical protein